MDYSRIALTELRVDKEAKENLQEIARGMGMTLRELIQNILNEFSLIDTVDYLRRYYIFQSEKYERLAKEMEEGE